MNNWDRDLPPGLRLPPVDIHNCRRLTHHFVQSTAAHSRSKGWLPCVKLDLDHVPLINPADNLPPSQKLELMIPVSDCRILIEALTMAMERAEQDVKVGFVRE